MRIALALCVASLGTLAAGDYSYVPKYKGLWLEVSQDVTPAGGVAQIHLSLTEPKPIIRTKLVMEFDDSMIEDIQGVSIFSETGRAFGTAMRIGNKLVVQSVAPDGRYGMTFWQPIVSLSVRLRKDAPAGAAAKFQVLPESEFYKASGERWNVESNTPGGFKVDGAISVDEVVPSGGIVKAGQAIRILGRGFTEGTQVEFYGVEEFEKHFVAPTEIQLVPEYDMQLDQKMISVFPENHPEKRVLPALRGVTSTASLYDNLSAMAPLFAPGTYQVARLDLPADLAEENRFAGVAVQNPEQDPVTVQVSAVDAGGGILFGAMIYLKTQELVVRDLEELFWGQKLPAGASLRVEADGPVQLMGLYGSRVEAAVLPIIPVVPESVAPAKAATPLQ
jgi:hypothetical protein